MQWSSKKPATNNTTFNPDTIDDIDLSNEDLEQELLDLLHDDPTSGISDEPPCFEQNKTNSDKDDELLLAELVKSMETEKPPKSNVSNKINGLELSEEDFFSSHKTSTGSTSQLPYQTQKFENSNFGSSLLNTPRNSGSTTNSKNDKDDELLLAELVKSMESEKSPASSKSNKMNESEISEDDIFGNHKTSSPALYPKLTEASSNNDTLGTSSGNTVKLATTDSKPNVRQAVLDYINPKTSNSGLDLLKNRHKEYKLAALKARDAGQLGKAKELLEASKCIGEAIVNIEAGKESFDPETDLPPPPSEYEFSNESNSNDGTVAAQPSASSQPVKSTVPDIMKTSIVCKENILARITYYKEKLKEITNDESKKRRYNRILTRYDEGLRACEHGVTSFEFEELVPPPGYPPLTDRSKMGKTVNPTSNDSKPSLTKPTTGHNVTKTKTQAIVELLTKRQDELKEAAKTAKQSGNIELAKTYIRSVLGMNQMIQAAEAGLPIDLTQLPRPPTLTDANASKPILSGLKCDPPVKYAVTFNSLSGDQLYKTYSEILTEQENLIHQLINQHRRNGGANAQPILTKLSDLLSVNTCMKKLLSKYTHQYVSNLTAYFEYANLPKSNMNAELADDILEISNIHGIAYPIPSNYSHIDTYVEIEFNLTNTNTPMKFSTNVVKANSEPVYSQTVKEFHVNTKSHSYRRFVQNNRCLKATVYYSRGLFRSWGVLGVTEIPLTGLVQSATVTHVGDLKDGRKVVGGRLQVQLRQRESLSGETVVYQQQPWLLLSASKQINESPKQLLQIENSKNSPSSLSSSPTLKQTDSRRSIRNENTQNSPVTSLPTKQPNSPRPIRIEHAQHNLDSHSPSVSPAKQPNSPRPIRIEHAQHNLDSHSPSSVSSKTTNSTSSPSSRIVIIRNTDNA